VTVLELGIKINESLNITITLKKKKRSTRQ